MQRIIIILKSTLLNHRMLSSTYPAMAKNRHSKCKVTRPSFCLWAQSN